MVDARSTEQAAQSGPRASDDEPAADTGKLPDRVWAKSIFPISKKVPVPSDMSLNRKFYPWAQLETGDSFYVRGGKVTALSAKAAWAGRQYGKQYVCRSVRGGVRVWCVGDRDPKEPRKRNKRVITQVAQPKER